MRKAVFMGIFIHEFIFNILEKSVVTKKHKTHSMKIDFKFCMQNLKRNLQITCKNFMCTFSCTLTCNGQQLAQHGQGAGSADGPPGWSWGWCRVSRWPGSPARWGSGSASPDAAGCPGEYRRTLAELTCHPWVIITYYSWCLVLVWWL